METRKEETDTRQNTNKEFRGGKMEKRWILYFQTNFELPFKLKNRGEVCGIAYVLQNRTFHFLKDIYVTYRWFWSKVKNQILYTTSFRMVNLSTSRFLNISEGRERRKTDHVFQITYL